MGSVTAILQILDFLLQVVPEAALTIGQVKDKLAQFKAEGRDPTAEELQALLADIDANAARIIANDERLNGQS